MIIHNKERFEPVHVESELLPGDDRAATYAVLREKDTGALIVVANVHLTAEAHLFDQKVENFYHVQNKVLELQSQYGAEGAVLLGDFNLYISSLPESGNKNEGAIDDVLIYGDDDIVTQSELIDGGTSDHDIVRREAQFQYSSESTQDNFSHQPVQFTQHNIIFDPNQKYQLNDKHNLNSAFGEGIPVNLLGLAGYLPWDPITDKVDTGGIGLGLGFPFF